MSWDIFRCGLKEVAENKPENIIANHEGFVTVKYPVNVFGKDVEKDCWFKLEKKM